MKSFLKVFIILILGVTFNAKTSFGTQGYSADTSKKQEVKKLETSSTNAAFLEHSRISFPVSPESLPFTAPALFSFVGFLSFFSFTSYSGCQKKLKVLRQRWLWLILFPFHSFY